MHPRSCAIMHHPRLLDLREDEEEAHYIYMDI